MKEAQIQTLFGKHNKREGVFELKLCKKTSIPFSSVEEHQEIALMQAMTTGVYHKISDMSYNQKPFDCFFYKGVGYIVICFWESGKKKMCYYITIMEWLHEKENCGRKSMTEEMCAKVAIDTLDLTKEN